MSASRACSARDPNPSPVQEAISERRLTGAVGIQISPIPRFPQAESDFPRSQSILGVVAISHCNVLFQEVSGDDSVPAVSAASGNRS